MDEIKSQEEIIEERKEDLAKSARFSDQAKVSTQSRFSENQHENEQARFRDLMEKGEALKNEIFRKKNLTFLYNATHKCDSRSQIKCCDTFRCEGCHAQHLRSKHSEVERRQAWSFHRTTYLVSASRGKIYKGKITNRKATEKKVSEAQGKKKSAQVSKSEALVETIHGSKDEALLRALFTKAGFLEQGEALSSKERKD